MTTESIVRTLKELLAARGEKFVLAESCTCGMVAAKLGEVPGISQFLCGSAVVYRPATKMDWLGVSKSSIAKHTTESQEVANEIALGVLKKTPEASWSLGVVGHIGDSVPENKKGQIFVCICRRTKSGNIKIDKKIEHHLSANSRTDKQLEAAEAMLTFLCRRIKKKLTPKKNKV